MVVRELLTVLGFKMNESQFQAADKGFDKLRDNANGLRNIVGGLFAGVAAGFSAKKIIDIGDEMQNIRARLGMLPQAVGDAGDAFDTVAQHASAAGASIVAYAGLYSKVGNAAKDYIKTQEDLLGITDTISKALTVGGASAQEASAVMLQFSQALGSGVLQGDEFRSMAEAAPQYLDQLSEAMNIPRENLKKMASQGKLTTKDVIESTRKMSGYFDERFKQMPMTVGRAMIVVGNTFGRMIDSLNRESLFITKIANGIVKALDFVVDNGGKVIDWLGGLGQAARTAGFLIATALTAAFGPAVIRMLAGFRVATIAAIAPYVALAAAVTLVALAIEDVYVWATGGKSVLGDLIAYIKSMDSTTKALIVTLGLGATAIAAVVYQSKILAGATVALNAVMLVVNGTMAAIRTAILLINLAMYANPVGLVIAGIVALGAAGYLLIAKWDTVKKWFSGFFDWFGDSIGWVFDKIKSIGSIIGDAFSGAGGAEIASAGIYQPSGSLGMSPSQLGQGRPNVNSQTTVNLTVPPGTPQDQQAAIQDYAKIAFGSASDKQLARSLNIYAP